MVMHFSSSPLFVHFCLFPPCPWVYVHPPICVRFIYSHIIELVASKTRIVSQCSPNLNSDLQAGIWFGSVIACFEICVETDQPRYQLQDGSWPNHKNTREMAISRVPILFLATISNRRHISINRFRRWSAFWKDTNIGHMGDSMPNHQEKTLLSKVFCQAQFQLASKAKFSWTKIS